MHALMFGAWLCIALMVLATLVLVLGQSKPTAPHPVCTVAHSQVVMIPTLCDKAQLCDMPIVAKVCDQIEIENPEVKP